MRAAAFLGVGVLTSAVSLLTVAGYGADELPDRYAPTDRVQSVRVDDEPVRLAQAFGANRKMQGGTRYAPKSNNPPEAPAPGTSSPFGPPPLELDQKTPAAGPGADGRENRDNTEPSDMPEVSHPSRSRGQSMRDEPSRSSSSNRPLRTLQQRMGSAQKPTNNAAKQESVAPPADTEAMTPATADAEPLGPSNGPVPPHMPEIRAVPRSVTDLGADRAGPSTNMEPTPGATRISQPRTTTMVPAVNGSNAPVVGGPISSSRRAQSNQSGSARSEEQPSANSHSSSTRKAADSSPSGPLPVAKPATPLTGPGIESDLPTASVETSAADRKEPVSSTGNVLFARQSPLLGVETTGPRSIIVGKESLYTVTLTNASDVPAQDVLVSVRIPAWAEVVGTKATNGAAQSAVDASGEPLVWQLVRLEARSKEQLVIRLVPRESRSFDLAVQWTYSPVASQTLIEVREPKLAMTLAGPDEVFFGQTKVYKLTLVNPGTADAENVVLMLSPVDGAPGSPTQHEIGDIRAGDSKLVEVELTARQPGILSFQAAAVADGNLRSEVAQEILVRRAGLKVTAGAPELKFAGTVATYDIAVSNPGNATAENVQVSAMLPAGSKYVSSNGGQFVAEQNKVTWTISAVRPGGDEQLQLHCQLDAPGANRLQVVATAAGELSDNVAAMTNVEALADLKLEVSDPSNPMAVGDEVTYEVRIRNRGQKAAENVDVAVFFSNGIEPVGAQGAQHELTAGQVVFRPIASIAPGAEVILKVKARGDQPGNHVFRAEVNCAAVGTKLASEETTLFYGDPAARSIPRTANRDVGSGAAAGQAPRTDASGTATR